MARTVFRKTYAKYEGSVAEDDIRIRLPIASRRVFLDRRTLIAIAIAIAVDRHILASESNATRTRTQTKAEWHKMIGPQKLFMFLKRLVVTVLYLLPTRFQ